MNAAEVKRLAIDAGFDLAGIAPAGPMAEAEYYLDWVARGNAGRMSYLTDHRAEKRRDPRSIFPEARSVLVVGQLYNSPEPYSTAFDEEGRAWISRYAWGEDYHDIMRSRLEVVARTLRARAGCDSKICVDTAPVLERPLARMAGLGWLGKNTCLINQERGSWFFLGELLLPLLLEADMPRADRCGSCTRCIDACPTKAIVPTGRDEPEWEVNARLCIAYLNIELKSEVPEELRPQMGRHIFGCDICQDVCPWNRRADTTEDTAWMPRRFAPPLAELAVMTGEEFRECFRGSPVSRARYQGFLRNVAIAMGNDGSEVFRQPLEKMAAGADAVVAEHARWALERIGAKVECG